MTETAGRIGFLVSRLLPIAAAAALTAGCSTTNLEDVAPVASMQAPQPLPETMPPPPASQPAQEELSAAVSPPAAGPPPVAIAAAEPAAPAVPERGALDTGTFPNLNVAPGTAAPQFTSGERSSKLSYLGSKRSAAQSGPATNASAEAAKVKRLRKLAQTHAADALKEIEAE